MKKLSDDRDQTLKKRERKLLEYIEMIMPLWNQGKALQAATRLQWIENRNKHPMDRKKEDNQSVLEGLRQLSVGFEWPSAPQSQEAILRLQSSNQNEVHGWGAYQLVEGQKNKTVLAFLKLMGESDCAAMEQRLQFSMPNQDLEEVRWENRSAGTPQEQHKLRLEITPMDSFGIAVKEYQWRWEVKKGTETIKMSIASEHMFSPNEESRENISLIGLTWVKGKEFVRIEQSKDYLKVFHDEGAKKKQRRIFWMKSPWKVDLLELETTSQAPIGIQGTFDGVVETGWVKVKPLKSEFKPLQDHPLEQLVAMVKELQAQPWEVTEYQMPEMQELADVYYEKRAIEVLACDHEEQKGKKSILPVRKRL